MPPPPPPPRRPRRAVQLAPSSLALVLRRRERAAEAGVEEASGAAVFQAFRRANAACYWNAGLARAVARVWLQGWLRGGVLLLQGPAAPLQLLRDAWLRRALRPPEGFLIRAVDYELDPKVPLYPWETQAQRISNLSSSIQRAAEDGKEPFHKLSSACGSLDPP